jgi:hypothetical protein
MPPLFGVFDDPEVDHLPLVARLGSDSFTSAPWLQLLWTGPSLRLVAHRHFHLVPFHRHGHDHRHAGVCPFKRLSNRRSPTLLEHHARAFANKILPCTASMFATAVGFGALASPDIRPVREMGGMTAGLIVVDWLLHLASWRCNAVAHTDAL